MMDTQSLINLLTSLSQKNRAKTQMTLGGLIARLQQLDQSLEMEGLYGPHSFRGYYCDIAFERGDHKLKVSEVLQTVRRCKGKTFVGYKGGNFKMVKDTPVWIAAYGGCGPRLMSIKDDGTLVTAHEDEVYL